MADEEVPYADDEYLTDEEELEDDMAIQDEAEAEADEDEDEDTDFEKEEDHEPSTPEVKPSKNITVHIIPKKDRITSNLLSIFELAAVIGLRAKHIEDGDEYYVQIDNETRAIKIAEKEIKMGRCPIIIERTLRQKGNIIYVEHWEVTEMVCTVPLVD